jgi:hypothetical protein
MRKKKICLSTVRRARKTNAHAGDALGDKSKRGFTSRMIVEKQTLIEQRVFIAWGISVHGLKRP